MIYFDSLKVIAIYIDFLQGVRVLPHRTERCKALTMCSLLNKSENIPARR